jgi:hypothetical protein
MGYSDDQKKLKSRTPSYKHHRKASLRFSGTIISEPIGDKIGMMAFQMRTKLTQPQHQIA